MTQVWSADVHEGKWRSENVKLMQPQLLGVILFRKKNISSSGPIWQNVLPSFVTLVLVVWPTMRTWVRWTCRDQARSVMPDPDYHQHPSCHLKTRLLRHLGVILFFLINSDEKKWGGVHSRCKPSPRVPGRSLHGQAKEWEAWAIGCNSLRQ